MALVSVNITGIEQARQLFGPQVVKQALNSTLNKLAAQGKTLASKKIRETYNIKARDLNAQIKVGRTRNTGFESEIRATGPRFSLMYFDPEQTIIRGTDAIITKRARGKTGSGGLFSVKTKRGNRSRGVTVKILNAEGRKLVKGPHGYGAFIAQGRRGLLGGGNARALFNRSEAKQGRGNFQVFMRRQAKTWNDDGTRTPIDKLDSVAVAHALGKNAEVVQEFIKAESMRVFQHELDFFVSRIRRG